MLEKAKFSHSNVSCFCILSLLPLSSSSASHISSIKSKSPNPAFNESYSFITTQVNVETKLHLSFWDDSTFDSDPYASSLGYASIYIKDLISRGGSLSSWFYLHEFHPIPFKPKSLNRENHENHENRLQMYKEILNNEESIKYLTTLPKLHCFTSSRLINNECSACHSTILALGVECKDCKSVFHLKCSKNVSNTCVGLGILKLNVNVKENVIMPLENYKSFVSILLKDNFTVALSILEKSNQMKHTDVYNRLMKVLDMTDSTLNFLKFLISREIQETVDVNTLFRGNTIATKFMDAYMKIYGRDYAINVLKPILKEIYKTNLDCDLKVSDEEQLLKNASHLQHYLEWILDKLHEDLQAVPMYIFNLKMI